jgi:2-hydroxy-6-oxo-octa-2,4-dienoate hydrolase
MTDVRDTAGAAGVGKSVKAFDIDTNYHEAGTGDVVILLHGSGPGVSAWTNWRRVMPALSTIFRVLASDMAGFGYTERRDDLTYDIKLWVNNCQQAERF